MILQPGILGVQIENSKYDLAEKWHVTDCIECGCCSFVCPSHRPLVQFMRRAKAEIIAKRKAAAAKAAAAKAAAEAAPKNNA
jgi:electron transport complex protein RnfC